MSLSSLLEVYQPYSTIVAAHYNQLSCQMSLIKQETTLTTTTQHLIYQIAK